MVKKVVLVVVLVVVLAVAIFLVSVCVSIVRDNRAKDEASRAEKVRVERATRAAVAQMISKTNAIDDWEKRITGDKGYRFGTILTVEFERQWLSERPILFIGAIKDIAAFDDTSYTVLVEKEGYRDFDGSLALSLRCPKKKMDLFLKEHPDMFADFVDNYVAIAAHVTNIRAVHEHKDFEEEVLRTGEGDLMDIVYIGHRGFVLSSEPEGR